MADNSKNNQYPELYSLKEGWSWVKLGDVCERITKGSTPTSYGFKYHSKGINFVKTENIDLDGNVFGIQEFINNETNDFLNRSKLKVNDILFSIAGTIGRVGVVKENNLPANTNQALAIIRLLLDSILHKFIYYYLKSPSIQKGALKKIVGVGRANLSLANVADFDIPLPPLPEQKKIVEKIEELFSELDNGVTSFKKAKEEIRLYRQSVLANAFNGKLIGNEKIDEKTRLPKDWKDLPLKNIVVSERGGLKRGPFGSSIKKSFFVKIGYKIYEQGNAINDDPYRGKYFVNEEKYKELEAFKVLPGDLIVSCSGVTLGRITEIPADAKPGIINQALLRIRLNKDIIISKYFIALFRSYLFQKRIFQKSQGTAMPNLVGLKDFKEIDILVPPIKQQHQIVSEIEKRFSEADNLEKAIDVSLAKAETLRQSILKQAFEGRLV